MSYGWSADLQTAVFARLTEDGELAGLVGGRIFDAPPPGMQDEGALDHVVLGDEIVRPWGTKSSAGAVHDFDVTVHSGREGFISAKRIAAAICVALTDARLTVPGGTTVSLRFLRASASRGRAPEKRTVALRFRAVLDEDS